MRQLKETFASEVGASSWKESASKYSRFATEENLEHYLSTTKLSGPVLTAFQQFCRRAIISEVSVSLGSNSQSVSQDTGTHTTTEGNVYHNIHLAETLPQNPGFSVILGSFCGRINDEVLIHNTITVPMVSYIPPY